MKKKQLTISELIKLEIGERKPEREWDAIHKLNFIVPLQSMSTHNGLAISIIDNVIIDGKEVVTTIREYINNTIGDGSYIFKPFKDLSDEDKEIFLSIPFDVLDLSEHRELIDVKLIRKNQS